MAKRVKRGQAEEVAERGDEKNRKEQKRTEKNRQR